MPVLKQTLIYSFDELSDRAKDKARDWYREGALDHDWWDGVYDDAAQVAGILGIDLRCRQRNHGGNVSSDGIAIYFSGFCSQGDCACFEGSYRYPASRVAKKPPILIREYAPQDNELHRIADILQVLQEHTSYSLTATIKHSGHYYYSHSMDISPDVDESYISRGTWPDAAEKLTQLLRDFADWIYARLEAEYEYLMSDEQVDESIQANEYTFDEYGNRD